MIRVIDHKAWIYLIVLAIIGGGLFLRTYNLGKYGFFDDELYHVIAARSLLEEGSPVFPDGHEYKRALPYTKIVALSFRLFGESETTARIPPVMINVVFLLVSFWAVKKWYNFRCALFFLVVMAFSPFILKTVRIYRMYSFFQLFYFLGSILFFYGMEYPDTERGKTTARLFRRFEEKHHVNLLLILLSSICFLISLEFHLLTVNFGFVLITYLATMWLLSIYNSGFKKIPLNKYSVGLIIILCNSLLFLLFRIDTFLDLFISINHVPIWAQYFERRITFYLSFLYRNYPAFFFLYPLGIFCSISENRKRGIFLLCSFLPILFLHSFIFRFKDYRYIFYIFPFFIMGVLPIIDQVLISGSRFVQDKTWLKKTLPKTSFAMALVFALSLLLNPWFPKARKVVNFHFPDWKAFHTEAEKLIDRNACIISNPQNHFYYYFGRKPDYYIQKSYFEEENDAEHWAGASPITNVDELKQIFHSKKDLYLITYNFFLKHKKFMDKAMVDFIFVNFEEIPIEEGIRVRLFRKRLKT